MRISGRILGLVLLAAASGSQAQETPTPPGATYRAPEPPDQRRVFFGDLHLHTAMSFDAWSFGTKVTPDQAYRFAKGETVMVPASQVGLQQGRKSDGATPAKRAWPLDFMAVTDHAEFMGVISQLDDPASPTRSTPLGRQILKDPHAAFVLVAKFRAGGAPLPPGIGEFHPAAAIKHAWDVEVKAANDNYEPGKFTTFVAYEWTSMADGKYNLHRNVIFNADHAPLPFTAADSVEPEKLWSYLETVRSHGLDVIAIPHNGNVSGGLMYDWNDSSGRPIDEAYAQRRALNEPLTEIVQNKGQSDTAPSLSPNDEFANFEIFDHLLTYPGIRSKPDGGYIRQAFGRGLVIQSQVGANPYKFGVVGASDFHNGLSASDESAFASGPFAIDPRTMMPKGDAAKRAIGLIKTPATLDMDADVNNAPRAIEDQLAFSGAGLTGVWAEENNRNSIFAALKRKETFATSGTRIRVRMFGGWDFDRGLIKRADWVAQAYARGAPMGSDLPAPPAAGAPRLILQAMKDPDGANLDRIQVIKIWLAGKTYKERIFDVALSGGRTPDPRTGRGRLVGDTVDLRTGRYKNTIGAPILTTVWRDPSFDPAAPAVYYARVLEIPTPRWSTLVAIANHLPIPKTVASTIQERAWSSPIWYSPSSSAPSEAPRSSQARP